MIISLKNKKIKSFVDDFGIQQDLSIDIGNTSVNFGKNLTLFSINDTTDTITNFKISIDGDFKIAYRDALTPNFKEVNTATDNEVKITDSGNKQIRKWNIFLLKEVEGRYTSNMIVSYTLNGTDFSFTFSIIGDVVGVDSKFVVLAQNAKFDITPDYYSAFKESEHRASEPNQLLLNEKRKEFLLNYFDLTAQVGSYHTLLSALHYFGYGDLLSIKELWKNESGMLQATTVTTEIQNFIDKRLLGFSKTNQLQLVYQINTADGTEDSDGFTNYISVLFDTEEILIKMYALKRVFEKDFLPLNTKIVDIIGEHTSTLGVDGKLWLNDERIDDIDLNQQNDGGFSFNLDVKEIEISEHEVLLKNKYFIASSTDPHVGDFIPTKLNGNNLDTTFFEIQKELVYDVNSSDDYTSLFGDNDFVERYDRSDFGLVSITLDTDTNLYSRYKFEIFEVGTSNTNAVYSSPLYNMSELSSDKKVIFGVRKLGVFKVKVYLFDYYGGVTWMNPNNNSFTITRGNIDFNLARIDRSNKGFEIDLDFYGTFPTTDLANKYIEIDAFDNTLDINTFDENNNTNKVLRFQSKSFDQRTLQMNTFQFNNVPLTDLSNTSLTDYGYEYAKYILDVIGDGTNGMRVLKMRNFEHELWDTIELNYDGDDLKFLNSLCTLVNSKGVDSVWNKFTMSIQYFSLTDIPNAKIVVRLIAKEVGVSINNVFVDFTQFNIYNPIVSSRENFYTYLPISGLMRLYPNYTLSGDLKINDKLVEENLTLTSYTDLETRLKNYFTNNNIKASVWNYGTFLIVSTRVDLKIEHPSFGIQSDVVRGKDSTTLKLSPSGDNFYKGEPFYAYIDLKTRIDGTDFKWTLTDALTDEVLDIQKSYVYRNMLVKSGSYTLTLESNDMFGTNKKVKNGFVIVS